MVLHPVGGIILHIGLKMQLYWNGWSRHCPCHEGILGEQRYCPSHS